MVAACGGCGRLGESARSRFASAPRGSRRPAAAAACATQASRGTVTASESVLFVVGLRLGSTRLVTAIQALATSLWTSWCVVRFLNPELGTQVGFLKTPATHLWEGILA